MKIRRPWFKFYASEWLSNRRVALMTPAQKGVYIDLLSLCWQEGSIPADPEELAFLLRLSKREFFPLWEVVKTHFSTGSDAKFMTNSRLETERGLAHAKSEKNRKAAEARWQDDANALRMQSERNAIQSQSQKEEVRDQIRDPHAHAFDLEAIYRAYPGRQGKAKGIEALRKAIKSQHQYELVLRAAAAYSDEEKRFKASGSKAFRPEVPYFSTWVNQRRWEDFDDKPKPTPDPVLFPDGMTPHESPATARTLHREAIERGFKNHAERMAAEGRL